MVQIYRPNKVRARSNKAKQLTLQIDDLNHKGEGVGRADGKVVFVSGALPGERVKVKPVEQQKRFLRAELLSVNESSAERTQPFCQHYGQCGGCALQHMTIVAQREQKQKRLARLLQEQSLQPTEWQSVVAGEAQQYRRRARISIWWGRGKRDFKIGFRQKQSKALVEIDSCPLLVESLETSFNLLRSLLVKLKRPKVFSHLEVCEANEGAIWILRNIDGVRDDDLALIREFAETNALHLLFEDNEGLVTPVTANVPSVFHYSLDVGNKSLAIGFAPQHFIQVNADINQQMVEQALLWLAPQQNETIADFFCGVGNFSLAVAEIGAKVVGVEGVAEMTERAITNAKALELADSCQFVTFDLTKNLSDFAEQYGPIDAVLMDPARAGAMDVARQMDTLSPSRIVYVSCDPATLVRDAAILHEQGYQIEKASVLDMFPHTSHLESMLLFRKDGKRRA
ncbi:23S rRNA (uracil(1939)-C(5))-methyltransferase RlmD [Corallincola platygyrae]|uniref:23S rRNA (Uracil(1939)-C(5))-methyltransferase RlmD n=1 Tax=Corallincola platygyrae TaxID=1193278 RepID=A0ABW4XM78_9GAMM